MMTIVIDPKMVAFYALIFLLIRYAIIPLLFVLTDHLVDHEAEQQALRRAEKENRATMERMMNEPDKEEMKRILTKATQGLDNPDQV